MSISITAKTRKSIEIVEDDYQIEILITGAVSDQLLLIHKALHAFTINIDACKSLSRSQLFRLNLLIDKHFPNSYSNLTKFKRSLYLSSRHSQALCLDAYVPDITLQGRSFEDHCLKIISLHQNYRWETTHEYHSTYQLQSEPNNNIALQ